MRRIYVRSDPGIPGMGGREMRLISSDIIPKSHPKVSYETQLFFFSVRMFEVFLLVFQRGEK